MVSDCALFHVFVVGIIDDFEEIGYLLVLVLAYHAIIQIVYITVFIWEMDNSGLLMGFGWRGFWIGRN